MHRKRISTKPSLSANSYYRHEKMPVIPPLPPEIHPESLITYLSTWENDSQETSRLQKILQLPYVIIEIGCGNGMLAGEIARRNPEIGIIATDSYDWAIPDFCGSHYREEALLWKERRLEIQRNHPDNLVSLRADVSILFYLPEASVDTVLLINPEPAVGRTVLKLLADPAVYRKIRPGENQIVVQPFSREMGVSCCGGSQFDHGEDWSRGLGFLMDSGFKFHKGSPVLWQVNLSKFSPYSRNSTQNDVYLFGDVQKATAPIKKSFAVPATLKKLSHLLNITAQGSRKN
jgi:hypothetical protein